MATQTAGLPSGSILDRLRLIKFTRRNNFAVFLLLVGIVTLLGALNTYESSVTTTLTFEPGPVEEVVHIVVPTLSYLTVVGTIFIVSGGAALFAPEDWQRYVTGLMFASGVVLIPTILVAAAANDRTNMTTMFAESLRLATPIAIGAMAGIWCERSGVINIAIEGMMLVGAASGFVTLFFLLPQFPEQTASVQLISVIVAVIFGGVMALLHAWLSITFRTDQIISGTVINILALGGTSFVRREFLLSTQAGIEQLPNVPLPVLSQIPIVGDAFFNKQPIFYLMFVVIIATHLILFQTRWGLRTRAVGEHPHAADTLGINVNRMRWTNVFIAGLIAGLAGAWFSLEATGVFNDGMTRGAGFIALAAMIFGKWTPFGAFGGALLFGFSDALGTRLQALDVPVPPQFLQMVPFVVTIVVLAGLIGRAFPPKAIGQPYIKE